MKKNATSLKKQRMAVLLIALVAVVLAAVYLILVKTKKGDTLRLPLYDEAGDMLDYRCFAEKGGSVTRETDGDEVVFTADSKITYTSTPYVFPEINFNELYAVKVENAYGTYTLFRDAGTGTYLIKGNEMLSYQAELISTLKIASCVMLSDCRLDEEYTDDASLVPYGLNEDADKVRVTVQDMKQNTYSVLIGARPASGVGYYAKVPDRPYVYLMPEDVSVFFADVNTFFVPTILPPLTQTQCQMVEKFDINRENRPFLASEMVPEAERTDTGNTDLHKITYPADYPVAPLAYYDVLQSFAGLTGTQIVETNVLGGDEARAEAIFAEYGFDQPTNDVLFVIGGKEFRFLSGDSFEDETQGTMFYIYAPYSDAVVILPLSTAPFLGYTLLDFINPGIFQLRIDDVAHLTIKTENKSLTYDFEGTGQDLVVTERASGTQVDVPSFRQLYIALLSVRIEGYADGEPASPAVQDETAKEAAAAVAAETGNDVIVSTVAPEEADGEAAAVTADAAKTEKTELSFSVTTRYGETYAYSFPIMSTTRSRIVNGTDREFYTNRSNITTILEKFEAFSNGETLESDW